MTKPRRMRYNITLRRIYYLKGGVLGIIFRIGHNEISDIEYDEFAGMEYFRRT